MHRHFIATIVAATALVPAAAFAQQSCEQQRSGRVVGTVAGAGIGAVLGSVIAGHGDKTTGAIIGGVGGALIGNQVTKPDADCAHAYGYYDSNNRWHATAVSRTAAKGYYDRDGQWVDGTPNGYYDGSGRWNPASGDGSANGYYESGGHWIPASANGYYDRNNSWVAGTASGYYDSRGRWVAGSTTGHYNASGRWISGTAGGRPDASGNWMADPQPGYYDSDGRWRAGATSGYYDGQGRWIATSFDSRSYGTDANSGGERDRAGMRRSIEDREARIEQRIRMASMQRTLSRYETNRAFRELNAIRRQESSMRHVQGQLSARDEATIQARLTRLSDRLRLSREEARADY